MKKRARKREDARVIGLKLVLPVTESANEPETSNSPSDADEGSTAETTSTGTARTYFLWRGK